MSEAADKLYTAVMNHDVETSLKLLESAGGACQAIDMAKGAAAKPVSWGDNVDFSLTADGNKETLMLYFSRSHLEIPVAGITLDKCEHK